MAKTIIVLMFLLPIKLMAQTTMCEPASTEIRQLLDRLATEGTSSIAMRKADNNNMAEDVLQATRLCEHHASIIDSLGKGNSGWRTTSVDKLRQWNAHSYWIHNFLQ